MYIRTIMLYTLDTFFYTYNNNNNNNNNNKFALSPISNCSEDYTFQLQPMAQIVLYRTTACFYMSVLIVCASGDNDSH